MAVLVVGSRVEGRGSKELTAADGPRAGAAAAAVAEELFEYRPAKSCL